jgi:regulator of cell morphogenesis and NO signaling
MMIQAGENVSRIVIEAPASIHVLEHYGVRFYDSKTESLEAACAHSNAPLEKVMEKLAEIVSPTGGVERWDFAPLPALVRFILDNHHTYERNKIQTIQGSLERVHKVSGEVYPELHQLILLFGGMTKGFLAHMKREENELFPVFLHEVAPGAAEIQRAKKAHQLLPLTDRLVEEHDVLLAQWEAMKTLTGHFAVPEGAGEEHRELLRVLSELEAYQHLHIHKENFILFDKIRHLALKR